MSDAVARTALARAVDALRRVDALDRRGPALNAVPLLDDTLLRRAGRGQGVLAGRVFTVKDSFAVTGLPLSAGSPAFVGIAATRDATVVSRLRGAGAALLGKTNMPPVAIGGGQPGVYGRTRSPFNRRYLAAAWHSGSSIGSAVSVAAGFCDFGIGEETVSSGRSPASNNAVVAYTPSWGVVSSAGNLPLHPYRDVVVPHTPDVASVRAIVGVLAGRDDDVWSRQNGVDLAAAQRAIEDLGAPATAVSLSGLRIGVPSLYVGESTATVPAIPARRSVLRLWQQSEQLLEAAGAQVIRVPFPLVEEYERRSATARGLTALGYLPAAWTAFELGPLMTYAWTCFLRDYGDGTNLSDLSASAIRPDPPFAVDAIENGRRHPGRDYFDFSEIVSAAPLPDRDVTARATEALRGLDAARRDLYEDWLDTLGLDALAFPANADVGLWDADVNPSAAAAAWSDGVVFSHGNHVLRRVGIPTVTVPMGCLDDIGMPVGLTLCGRAWDDARLIAISAAVEAVLPARPRAPLPGISAAPLEFHDPIGDSSGESRNQPRITAIAIADPQCDTVAITIDTDGADGADATIEVDGRVLSPAGDGRVVLEAPRSWWNTPRDPLALAIIGDRHPLAAAAVTIPLGHPVDRVAGEPEIELPTTTGSVHEF